MTELVDEAGLKAADAFLRAIVNDEEPPVTARDGGNTATGILAAIEALERGAPVKVPVC